MLSISDSSVATDRLRVDALGGNDFINGSGVVPQLIWDRIDLVGGAGDDVIIGTPDDDFIDSGLGNDRVSGMGGTDTFVDAGGTDEIVESSASDFGLYGNLLVIGHAVISGTGVDRSVTGFTGATAEDISVFEKATLSGTLRYQLLVDPKPFVGGESNVFAVGSATGSLLVNGVNRTGITPWRGTAILSGRDYDDTYIVEAGGLRGGTVSLVEGSDGVPGTDTLLIHGTNARETGRIALGPALTDVDHPLTAIGSTQISVDDGGATPATIIASQFIESTTLLLRGGNDTLAVRSLNLALTVDLGDGDDTVLAGSKAIEQTESNQGGVLDLLGAHLTLIGGTGRDTLRNDDSADTDNNTGMVTSTLLSGLDTQGIDYTGFEVFTLDLGSGNDTLTVNSTVAGPVAITTGAGNDTVNVGSTTSLLDLIGGTLSITGGTGSDALTLTDSGDTKDNTGHLTSSTVTGLGLGGTLTYTGFEALTLTLGSGNDTLFVDSTHAGTTLVNAGAGTDHIDIETVGGLTRIEGAAGADTIRVNPVVDAVNGLAAKLTLDGGTGADAYLVNQWGNGDSTIDVADTGNDGLDNTLTINGTPVADSYLLRRDLVALLNTLVAGAWQHVERVQYTTAILHLTIDALGGDDNFALDDNSAITKISGSAGNDSFQIGQIFGAIVSPVPPATVNTTRGRLTNGVSFATTIDGGIGNDFFGIFHNLATLDLQGGDDDDTFVVRTFIDVDKTTSIAGGAGADKISYTGNAPLNVDGGDGHDTLILFGTELDDTFLVTSTGIFGGGRAIGYNSIEQVELDTLDGDDLVVVHSTLATVTTIIRTGAGGDRVAIGGAIPTVDTGTATPVLPSTDPRSALIQGPLTVTGGTGGVGEDALPAAVLLPGETATAAFPPPPPPAVVPETDLVDTLTIDNSAGAGDSGTLTSGTFTGFGLGAAGIVYSDFEVVSIQLGAGNDSITVVNTILGRTIVRTGDGADTVFVKTIDGVTAVETEGGNDDVTVSSDGQLLDRIAALLTLDTGAGVDSVHLDDRAETDRNVATITPSSVTGLDMGGGTPAAFVQRLIINATGGSYVLHFIVDGVDKATAALAWNASTNTILAAISAVLNPYTGLGIAYPFTDNVAIRQYGNVLEIAFQGQFRTAGIAFADSRNLVGTLSLVARNAGVDYYGVETLDLITGSAADVINVQGTSAVTNVTTNDGDDRVYVSSLAAYGLDDHPAYVAGDLNALSGALNLDLGAGRHTLMISDEAATVGDGNVRLTRTGDTMSLAGLALGTITYKTSGNLADGITIWTGSGNDTVLVDATLKTPGVRTVTFLNTGLGNDAVVVDLSAADDDVLVLNTQGGVQQVLKIDNGLSGGDDHGTPADEVSVSVDGIVLDPSTYVVDRAGGTVKLLRAPSPSSVITVTVRHFTVTGWTVAAGVILATSTRTQTFGAPQQPSVPDDDTVHGESSTLPLIVFGGQGNDTIFGGNGGDVIFGDRGVVRYGDSEFGHGGLGDRTDGVAHDIESAQTTDAWVGGDDTIAAQGADDRIFGGSGSDTIVAGDGDNVVIGDNGSWTPALITTSAPTFGGGDRITSGAGDDLLLGGSGGDTIVAGDGDDIVLGDQGSFGFGSGRLQFVRTSDFNDGGSTGSRAARATTCWSAARRATRSTATPATT